MIAADFPRYQLKATQNLQDRIWSWKLTIRPYKSTAAEQSERGCIKIKDFVKQNTDDMRESIPQECKTQITSDQPKKGRMTLQCSGAFSGFKVNYRVQHVPANHLIVEAQMLSNTTFIHEYKQEGECKYLMI
ncbi:hypothetical protein [Acinetobacter nematophilus]|uniref:Uncharacterized protein n=1 Tax=Acinetobacter nematophilus TaxID=2994642 RepID=A0A9X3DVE4_9GAMM|nr:hypothetical protein [Acinetobacter nematophilus]MCX5468768.1 hypothetical protein [Acinetobacter nematophilus]